MNDDRLVFAFMAFACLAMGTLFVLTLALLLAVVTGGFAK